MATLGKVIPKSQREVSRSTTVTKTTVVPGSANVVPAAGKSKGVSVPKQTVITNKWKPLKTGK